MEYSKEDLMEAKKQIWGVGENMGTEEPLRRLRGLSMPLTDTYYPRAACCNTDLALLLCHRQ